MQQQSTGSGVPWDPLFSFDVYLRTGRLVRCAPASAPEVKFNPWHDPDDGRFTFAGQGTYFGGAGGSTFRPGGGSFGGGGAGSSESWGPPHSRAPKPPPRNRTSPVRPPSRRVGPTAPAVARPATLRADRPYAPPRETWRRVTRNGYDYRIDRGGRARQVSGQLMLAPAQSRSRPAQANAGGPDRRATDDGGHYIARRFNGPTDAFNHFAQNANFNRGGYRALEDRWAKAIRDGKKVRVKIIPFYRAASRRPSLIQVWFWIDGHRL